MTRWFTLDSSILKQIKKFRGKGDGGLGEGEKHPFQRGFFPFPQNCKKFFLFCLVLLCLCPTPAHAYLDPGTGSMLVSAFVGMAATLLFAAKNLYYRFNELQYRLRGLRPPKESGNIVFYGEAKQYWNTFRPVLEALEGMGEKAVYLCSDAADPGLLRSWQSIDARYIGAGNAAFATLNMLEADLCVLTTPGLDVLQIHRSPGVKHYAHLMHSITDAAFYKLYAFDYFDSILCSGPHQMQSLRHLESLRGTAEKKLLETGCCYMDVLAESLEREENEHGAQPRLPGALPRILVAPTWGRNGLLALFGSELLKPLVDAGYPLCIRPHPQSFTAEKPLLDALIAEFSAYPHVSWDRDASPLEAMRSSDVLLSDLSGIVFDYAFILKKPVVTLAFTPDTRGMDAADLPWPAWELSILPQLGAHIAPGDIAQLPGIIAALPSAAVFAAAMESLKNISLFNYRRSGDVAAEQLLAIRAQLRESAAAPM